MDTLPVLVSKPTLLTNLTSGRLRTNWLIRSDKYIFDVYLDKYLKKLLLMEQQKNMKKDFQIKKIIHQFQYLIQKQLKHLQMLNVFQDMLLEVVKIQL